MNLPILSMISNYNYASILNNLLINNNGVKFGNSLETISSVLGKNQLINTLSPFGMMVVYVLDMFDKDHAIKSIKFK